MFMFFCLPIMFLRGSDQMLIRLAVDHQINVHVWQLIIRT